LALTDHDTLAGLPEAASTAAALGIRFISGIELEITSMDAVPDREAASFWPPGEFHLLGLGIEKPGPAFLGAIAGQAEQREARNAEILARFPALGIEADYAEVQAFAGGKIVGRPHFAALLVRRKIARNTQQAFDRYLGRGKPLYVPKKGLAFTEAAEYIHGAGGLAVLAHPMSLYLSWGRLPAFIAALQGRGLDGIEAWHPTAKLRACRRLEDLGRRLGLVITAGSDFHGAGRPDRKLGYTAGNREIDESFLAGIPFI
jgi:predicted metal-dependent phosphoesterase TrpH